MQITLFYVMIVIAYLLGSLSSAILVCKYMKLPDPLTQGSKNPGATNVLRIAGKLPAILVLVGDILKGFIPVALAKLIHLDGQAAAFILAAVIVGHMFPVYFKFRGGKGIATALGGLLALSWPLALAALIVWAIVVGWTRYVSLGSIAAAASVPAFNQFLGSSSYFAPLVILAILVVVRHRKNINNLLENRESKLGSKH